MKQVEELLAKRLANHIRKTYPDTPFRFDLTDKIGRTNGIRHKQLMGKWSRGYPDLFIAHPNKKYAGMYLELKDTPNGEVPNTEHTREQAAYHEILRRQGYFCEFGVGYEKCVEMIDAYMSIKKRKKKQ